jgi:mono/diheme cytochrome c family protein
MRRALSLCALIAAQNFFFARAPLSTPDRDVFAAPDPLPARLLRAPLVVDERPTLALPGALLFRSPEILGAEARALRVSCQTCHPNGGRHATLSLGAASPTPGRIDLSSGRFGSEDDGVANAVVIPTLRDLRARLRFGADGARTDLMQMVAAHIVDDFAGDVPARTDLVALVRFLELQAPRANPLVDERGRLRAGAPAAAHRGEAVFARPLKALSGQSCATCHVPMGSFTDGRTWPMRAGEDPHVRTPSLLDLGERGPFFVDGRAATLKDVVLDYERRFSMKLSAPEQDALVAYLVAIGGAPVVDERSLESALVDQVLFLRLLEGDEVDARVCRLVLSRVDEALLTRTPPPRISFKVDGARARVAQAAKACVAASDRGPMQGDLVRLREDITRLAREWQDLIAPRAPDDP